MGLIYICFFIVNKDIGKFHYLACILWIYLMYKDLKRIGGLKKRYEKYFEDEVVIKSEELTKELNITILELRNDLINFTEQDDGVNLKQKLYNNIELKFIK